jgi:ferritin-like metal-binding protein YciE
MSVESLSELLKHELGDLYFAEKTILKGAKKLQKEVKDPAMLERMQQHAVETEQQLKNIEAAFAALGEKAKAQKCPGILGLMTEHDEFKSDEEPSRAMLEAFDLGTSLRIEHYEIAAYTTAIALAKAIGNAECARLLTENLAQEVAMEKFLRTTAVKSLRQLAA